MDNFNAGLGAHKSMNLYSDIIIYIFNLRLYYNIVICIQMIMNLIVLENLKTNFYDFMTVKCSFTVHFYSFSILSH